MNRLSRLIVLAALSVLSTASYAQFNESGIAAGFFDGSRENEVNIINPYNLIIIIMNILSLWLYGLESWNCQQED